MGKRGRYLGSFTGIVIPKLHPCVEDRIAHLKIEMDLFRFASWPNNKTGRQPYDSEEEATILMHSQVRALGIIR